MVTISLATGSNYQVRASHWVESSCSLITWSDLMTYSRIWSYLIGAPLVTGLIVLTALYFLHYLSKILRWVWVMMYSVHSCPLSWRQLDTPLGIWESRLPQFDLVPFSRGLRPWYFVSLDSLSHQLFHLRPDYCQYQGWKIILSGGSQKPDIGRSVHDFEYCPQILLVSCFAY